MKLKHLVRNDNGVLVIDESTLDKTYSHQIEMVTRYWSGKHHRVVQGINLISTIWTDGQESFLLRLLPMMGGRIYTLKSSKTGEEPKKIIHAVATSYLLHHKKTGRILFLLQLFFNNSNKSRRACRFL